MQNDIITQLTVFPNGSFYLKVYPKNEMFKQKNKKKRTLLFELTLVVWKGDDFSHLLVLFMAEKSTHISIKNEDHIGRPRKM